MNIGIFGKNLSHDNIIYVERVIEKLRLRGCKLFVYRPYYELISEFISMGDGVEVFEDHFGIVDRIDCLFSIGGDGTILDAMPLVRDSGIPILGINIGRLGFLSSISRDEIMPAIDSLLNQDYRLDTRALISISKPEGLFEGLSYALNDVTITRKDSTSLVVINVYIDDKFLNTYWADGLIVATPTGSTAYSLSSGGPIITPGSENFVITPIAPHNLTVRPIVIPDDSKIRIVVDGRDDRFLLSLDSRVTTIGSHFEMSLEKASFKVNLVRMKEKDFYSTIRDKLKWGLDIRN